MAHPYKQESRASERGKIKSLTGFAKGGRPHSDAAEDRKLFAKMFKQAEAKEIKIEGKKSGGRLDHYTRGGKTKRAKSKVKIVLMPPSEPIAQTPSAPVPGVAGAGGTPLPPAPPMMNPMMRKAGGAVTGPDKAVLTESEQEKFLKRARGGAAHKYPHLKGGMDSGLGRLGLSKFQKKARS